MRTPPPLPVLLLAALFLVFARVTAIADEHSGTSPASSSPGNALLAESGMWSLRTPSGPFPGERWEASSALDPIRHEMIVFGGAGTATLSDTWRLKMTEPMAWTNITPPTSPPGRRAASLVYDPVRDRMILFAGDDGGFRNDIWVLSLSGTPTWTQLSVGGTPPSPRKYPMGVYDASRDRIVYFGGHNGGALGETWALNLSPAPSWQQLITTGNIGPRWSMVGYYDEANDRLVAALGQTSSGLSNEVWALPFGSSQVWSKITTNNTPPTARFLASGGFDEINNRLLIYGGYDSGPRDDLWELSYATVPPAWTLLNPTGAKPSARRGQASVLDTDIGRMIVFGGFSSSINNELWQLALTPAIQVPTINGVVPAGGPVGKLVTLYGIHLDGALEVRLNGVLAPIIFNTAERIDTEVPVGATTGKFQVTTALGTAESPTDFVVGDVPMITSTSPMAGKVRTVVRIHGANFTGASHVSFGPVGSAAFTVASSDEILATVDSAATTGHVFVTTPTGSAESDFDFTVLPPDPSPQIVAVRDVPRDQGGKVVVAWNGSDFDLPGKRIITKYRVWRRADLASASRASRLATSRELGLAQAPDARTQADEYWESLVELPASWLAGYAYTASTPSDSSADGPGLTAYFVQALTADPFVFYNSAPDSGYSVDNLAPPLPSPFVATYDAYQVALHWGASRAPDLREFRLYRGSGANFPLSPSNLLVATRDTAYVDPTPVSSGFSYKLVAVDVHGNVSLAALVTPDVPVATLASLVKSEADEHSIRLTWYSGGNAGLAVALERREAVDNWSKRADLFVDASGFVRFDDEDVEPGHRYGYRLSIPDGDGTLFSSEVWMTAETSAFALRGPWPNPATEGRFRIAFDLPTSAPASLDLWDLAGRRVERVAFGSEARGRHTFEFGSRTKLAPGVYYLRMTQAELTTTRRVVVLE